MGWVLGVILNKGNESGRWRLAVFTGPEVFTVLCSYYHWKADLSYGKDYAWEIVSALPN